MKTLSRYFILVSVLFGSALFGIAGEALLAIATLASLLITAEEYLAYRREFADEARPRRGRPPSRRPRRRWPSARVASRGR